MAVLRMPHLDAETVRDVMRDLSKDIDVSRLSGIRDDLARMDLPSAADVRRELDRHDIQGTLTDLREGIGRIDRDAFDQLPVVGRVLGRPTPRPWLQAPTTAVVLGAAVLIAGAVLGGVLAWLYQPGAGVQRRKAVRRRLRKLQRTIQHSR